MRWSDKGSFDWLVAFWAKNKIIKADSREKNFPFLNMMSDVSFK